MNRPISVTGLWTSNEEPPEPPVVTTVRYRQIHHRVGFKFSTVVTTVKWIEIGVVIFAILLLASLAWADLTAGAAPPTVETVGTAETLDAAQDTASVALQGQNGAVATLAAGTLEGTLVGEVSPDGGTTWVSAVLVAVSGDVATSVADPTAAVAYGIFPAIPVTHARLRVSAYTTGSVVAQLRAVTARPSVTIAGTDEANIRVPVVKNSGPASDDYGLGVRLIGASITGCSNTDDGAFTVGSDCVAPIGGIYRTSRDSLNDNDVGAIAITATRAQYVTIETPAGDSVMDDTNDAVNVIVKNIPQIGAQSATSTVTSYTNCASQENLNFTTTTLQQMVAKAASKNIYICSVIVWANGDTNVTFYEGTTTTNPCDTSQGTLAGPFYLSSTNGRAFVMPASLIAFLRTETQNEELCVGTSASVATTVFFTWAQY